MRSSTWMDVNGVVLIGVTLPLMNISEQQIISSSSAVSHGVSHGSLSSTGERGCAQCKEANGGRQSHAHEPFSGGLQAGAAGAASATYWSE